MGELSVIDVDRAYAESHGLGVLDREVSQATHPRDDEPLTRSRLTLLDSLVGRDPGADERCGLCGRQAVWNVCDVVWVGENVLGKTAVLRITPELRFRTHCLP